MIGILGGMGTQAGLDFCSKLAKINRGKADQKYPLFVLYNKSNIPDRKQNLKKYKKILKSLENGCKFPLGIWKEGEKRTFNGSSGGKPRKIELTILKLGKKQNSSIKFNWKLYNMKNGKLMDDNDYTFSPGKAMVGLNDKNISK